MAHIGHAAIGPNPDEWFGANIFSGWIVGLFGDQGEVDFPFFQAIQ